MDKNTLDRVPKFTDEENQEDVGTEQAVKPAQAVEESTEEEKETPVEPASTETPSESENPENPEVLTDDTGVPDKSENEVRLEKQVQGLLNEIKTLRGKNRQLTPQEQQTLIANQQKVDELQDVNPDDVQVIDKILRAKGYLTKTEAEQMTYKAIEQDELNKFLEKYPEYRPENDPNDLNWSVFQRELSLYARPRDPRQWSEILERAHRGVSKPSSDRGLPEKKQQVKTAQVGSGGTQRSSSSNKNSFDPETIIRLRQGGFSDEDIAKMQSRR